MSFEISTILVGTDFSPQAELALDNAIYIAGRTGAQLVIAHAGNVVHAEETSLVPESAVYAEYQRIVEEHQAANRAKLEELVTRAASRGVTASAKYVENFADSGLTDAAVEVGAQLIAIGTVGRTGLRRVLLGSIAERVVRLSRRHVLVARTAPPEGGFRKLLVATDFSVSAQRALEAAVAIAPPGGTIEIVHAWHLPPLSGPPLKSRASEAAFDSVRQSIEGGARTKAEELVAPYRDRDVTFEIAIIQGTPAHALAEHAERGCDLLLMGGQGHRGLRRFFLGSVAEATVRRATCSVLVLHAPRHDNDE